MKIALVQDGSFFYIGKVKGTFKQSLKLDKLTEELHIPARTFPPELVIKIWDVSEDQETKGEEIKNILYLWERFQKKGKRYRERLNDLKVEFDNDIAELTKSV